MKKITSNRFFPIGVVLVAVFFLLSGLNVAYARLNNRTGDEVVTATDAEDNVMSRVILPANTTATSSVLVDLSDNTNFKHTPSSGSVDIAQIAIDWQIDDTATTSKQVKFGVVASTTASGAVVDIYWFAAV